MKNINIKFIFIANIPAKTETSVKKEIIFYPLKFNYISEDKSKYISDIIYYYLFITELNIFNFISFYRGPLNDYVMCVFGKFKSPKSVIEKNVMELGGAVSQKLNESVQCCISSEGLLFKKLICHNFNFCQ